MRMRSKFVAFAACGAVALTACGGGDSSSTVSTAAAISKDDFVTQAEAICAAGNKEINAGAKAAFGSGQPSSDDLAAFATDTLAPSVQSQIDQIKALGLPEGDEDVINQALSDAQAGVDALKADPASVAGDTPELTKGGQELSDYGATSCGN